MPFDFDTPKTFFEKGAKAVDWIAEEIIRQKNWRSLLVLIDVVLFLAFNPFEWPFPNLLSLFPQLRQLGWYAAAFWSLIGVIFIIAVIVAARAKRKPAEHAELKLGAIKGLLPFGYEDAEVFSHLQRDQSLKECLQAISDEQWRFGVLSGESGAGKTSFLQAGLWPELERRKFRCVHVKFSDLDPFESVRRACLKRLSFADGAPDEADFQGLLRAVVAQDRTPVVFFFDQFEQFFVHRKRKKDREPFAQALARWFAEAQSMPIKILICVRGDFFDRLNELQKAMRYSLSPTQSFRLERFEPDQATEVFCFLAEKEGLEYDRKFISEMTRQELADAEDGLISPVDVQVLARMIERQTAQGARAFNRATFQKLGGVEGLLERYMTTALEPLGTQLRRQAAIKVLLALTDLERNARAGALSFEDLRQKLDDIADSELKDAVAYLLLGDVRLISPSSENEEEKFELAHERLIPALRRLAGKQLSQADRADQLLDRRTNEWLGNERASRYLFSWSELRLLNKQRRFLTWGKQRQAKEELLAASRRRFRLQYAAVGLAPLLVVVAWIGWNSNAWQTHLIKRELRNHSAKLYDDYTLSEIAKAFAYAGDSQLALQIVGRISDNRSKTYALNDIASFYVKLGETGKDIALLSNAIKITERINDDYDKAIALRAIASSIAQLGETINWRDLLPDATELAERIHDDEDKSFALSAISLAYAKLGDKEKANALLSDAIKTVERISKTSSKALALRVIAGAYARLGDKEKATALFSEAIETAERIIDDPSKAADPKSILESKAHILNKIADFIASTGESLKDSALMSDAIETAKRIDNDSSKAYTLREVAESYINLGDKERARVLLSDAIETAERISGDRYYPQHLYEIATSYARLGDTTKDKGLLSVALKLAERTSDARFKSSILSVVAESYADLGDKEKAISLLSEVVKMAERISDDNDKSSALDAVAKSYARIGWTLKDSSLLSKAVKTAEQMSNDFSKALTLRQITKSYAKLAESSNDRALYDNTFKFMEGRRDDSHRNSVLEGILSSKFAIADVARLRLLTALYDTEAGKAKALAIILKARLHPEMIGKE